MRGPVSIKKPEQPTGSLASPPPTLLLALPALYVPFPALSSRFFTQADVRGTAAEVGSAGGESEARRGGDTDSAHRRQTPLFGSWKQHWAVDLVSCRLDVDGRLE